MATIRRRRSVEDDLTYVRHNIESGRRVFKTLSDGKDLDVIGSFLQMLIWKLIPTGLTWKREVRNLLKILF